MNTVDINPTTNLTEYKREFSDALQVENKGKVTALGHAIMDSHSVMVYAQYSKKRYKGVFKIFDRTLTITLN